MIIVQVKEGELIERALKKFKRKFEKTGIVRNSAAVRLSRSPQSPTARR